MNDSNSSTPGFQISGKLVIGLSIVFGILLSVLVAIISFGPIIYTILLKHFFGQEFDFTYATQFLNNVVSISAIALSVIAIIATIIGLSWQFIQTESSTELKKDIKEIREEMRSRGFQAPMVRMPVVTKKFVYESKPIAQAKE